MIKLNISKAYDKLELSFLEVVMRKLRFSEMWISRIITCVTTISYSILGNRQLGSVLSPLEVSAVGILYPLITLFV